MDSATTRSTPPRVERRVDDAHGPVDVGPDGLDGVVLAGGHLLEGGGVHDVVHPVARAPQPRLVAHVADEEAQARGVVPPRLAAQLLEAVAHHELLVLVARVHDDLFRFVALQHVADELVPERAGAAGHEHGLAIKHGLSFSLWGFQSADNKHLVISTSPE